MGLGEEEESLVVDGMSARGKRLFRISELEEMEWDRSRPGITLPRSI